MLGMDVISEPFKPYTCKNGYTLIDYILCSKEITPMLGEAKVVTDVGWWPHLAISVEIVRRPTQVRVHLAHTAAPFKTFQLGIIICHSIPIWDLIKP